MDSTKNLENENHTMHEEIAKRGQNIPDLNQMVKVSRTMTRDEFFKIAMGEETL